MAEANRKHEVVRIVGGGLAGSEAALQLADRGHQVVLHEMRGVRPTEAHSSDRLAELVCSNTFKSERSDTSSGAFKLELDLLGSRLLPLAREARVPGGHALALDREVFAELVTQEISKHPRIELRREEVTNLDDIGPAIIATGPLTSPDLQTWLQGITGNDALYFYDAIAPSLLLESVDADVVFRQSRYDKGGADYLNCPMDKAEYEGFIDALLAADRAELHEFEKTDWFSGCMPIEAIAERGRESLRFGPMRPVGLNDPRSGRRPWAAVQLRQETRDGSLFGLVGFQTRLRYGDQTRVFRMIPGLEKAEFVRLGSLHRNTYVDAPRTLNADLSLRARDDLWLAGQITGCEGYVESLATGLVAALALDARLAGRDFSPPANDSMLGSLLAYLRDTTNGRPSPMNVNFGLLPPLEVPVRDKRLRKEAYAARGVESIRAWSRELLREQAG